MEMLLVQGVVVALLQCSVPLAARSTRTVSSRRPSRCASKSSRRRLDAIETGIPVSYATCREKDNSKRAVRPCFERRGKDAKIVAMAKPASAARNPDTPEIPKSRSSDIVTILEPRACRRNDLAAERIGERGRRSPREKSNRSRARSARRALVCPYSLLSQRSRIKRPACG